MRTTANVFVRRGFFVLVNLFAMIFVAVVLTEPVRKTLEQEAIDLTEKNEELQRYLTAIKNVGHPDINSGQRKLTVLSRLSLSGGSDGEIVANLQSRVKDLAALQGASVRLATPLLKRVSGRFIYYGAHFQIVGRIDSIAHALYSIEDSEPVLFITSAVLSGSEGLPRFDNQSEAPLIQAEVDVFGVKSQVSW